MTKIKTVCPRDCPDTCFIDVEVKDNKIVSVKGSTTNPVTQGFLCPRGRGDPARVYSKDRVLYPHVRTRDNNGAQFERVSWEEAIQFITNKLQETIQTHGDESILLLDYAGNQGFLAMQYPHRLWNAIGATKTDYALCSTSGHKGIGLQYGLAYGVQPEELLDMEVIT
ncbi:MAG: molybdopterin-dependent oxidoreductase, partial [Candidatus Heimdallarchaeota archaeon]|nr:molybdopterin-dependent oxidoreductase [Candidatus Heimdallarchaeota archaeon]